MTQNSSRKVENTDERSTQTLSALETITQPLCYFQHIFHSPSFILSVSRTQAQTPSASHLFSLSLLFHMVFLTVSHTNEIKWTVGLFGNDGCIITVMFE